MVQHLEIKWQGSRYFSQRPLNYTNRFSPNSDYVFYPQSVLQQIQLQNQIFKAMTKFQKTNYFTIFQTIST